MEQSKLDTYELSKEHVAFGGENFTYLVTEGVVPVLVVCALAMLVVGLLQSNTCSDPSYDGIYVSMMSCLQGGCCEPCGELGSGAGDLVVVLVTWWWCRWTRWLRWMRWYRRWTRWLLFSIITCILEMCMNVISACCPMQIESSDMHLHAHCIGLKGYLNLNVLLRNVYLNFTAVTALITNLWCISPCI